MCSGVSIDKSMWRGIEILIIVVTVILTAIILVIVTDIIVTVVNLTKICSFA